MWWLQPPCWASRGCFLPRSKAVAKRQRSSADAQACRRIVGPSGLDRCTAAGCVHPCAPRRQHQTLRGWRWLRVTSERVLEQPEHTRSLVTRNHLQPRRVWCWRRRRRGGTHPAAVQRSRPLGPMIRRQAGEVGTFYERWRPARGASSLQARRAAPPRRATGPNTGDSRQCMLYMSTYSGMFASIMFIKTPYRPMRPS